MISFKEFLAEASTLQRGELTKKNDDKRLKTLAKKIKEGTRFLINTLNDDNEFKTIIIKKVSFNGNIYTDNPVEDELSIDKLAKDVLKNPGNIEIVEFTSEDDVSEDDVKTTGDLIKTQEFGGKGNAISSNTQEIMTAAIVLGNKKYSSTEIDINLAKEIITAAKEKFNDVIGVEEKQHLVNQFNNNWDDLATAVSSSNAILNVIDGKPKKAFFTGTKWPKEIEKFDVKINGIKNYNSSDIVISTPKKYYGFSLKKKGTKTKPDPTLINKPVTGDSSILNKIISKNEFNKIEEEKIKFFNKVILDYSNDSKSKIKPLSLKEIKKMDPKDWGKLLRSIPNNFVNDKLAGKENNFWIKVNEIIEDNSEELAFALIKLIFRYDLQPMLKEDKIFDFFLLTGIGQREDNNVKIEEAEIEDLDTIVEVLSNIFKENKIHIGKTMKDGKPINQPFEFSGKGKRPAAKLFYTIYNGKIPLVNLEIRYKGSKTAEPQFQATATKAFKSKVIDL